MGGEKFELLAERPMPAIADAILLFDGEEVGHQLGMFLMVTPAGRARSSSGWLPGRVDGAGRGEELEAFGVLAGASSRVAGGEEISRRG